MILTARLLPLLAVILLTGACHFFAPLNSSASPAPAAAKSPPPESLEPSSNLIVGRVLVIDPVRGFAIVDLGSEPPPAALAEGTELIARTNDLRETARLRASRYTRGRTLGTMIVSGQPSPGDEVVWQAP